MSKHTTPLDIRDQPTVARGRVSDSKRVTQRIKAAGALCGAIEKKKARAADGFRRRFAEDLRDGETVPDQTLALELAGRSVTRALGYLTKADSVYSGQANRRKALNQACIEVARWEVYPELVDVRRRIETTFGREKAKHVHEMTGKTLRKPGRLYPQLEGLVLALRGSRALPKPKRPGARVDRQGWLERLEPGYLKLTAMLDELNKAERLEHARREDRDFELESFDVVYAEALAFVRSVFRLGGLPDSQTWFLLPNVQRRRLRGKARQEREARAEGRRGAGGSGDLEGAEAGPEEVVAEPPEPPAR